MRSAGWCVCVIAAAGCGDRALTVSIPDAAEIAQPDASVDSGQVPVPGSIVAAVPVGTASAAGGATDIGPVVALDDGGVILAGTFSGTVSFASDKTLTARGMRDGFIARYRSDTRLVWVQPLRANGAMAIAGAVALPGNEAVIAGWFSVGVEIPGGPSGAWQLQSSGGLDGFVARVASDGSVRWAVKEGGRGDDIIRAVAATVPMVRADGTLAPAIVLTGAVGTSAVFGLGEPRQAVSPVDDGPIFAASLSSVDGALSWVRFAGGGVPAQGYGIAADQQGRVAVTGYVNGPALFGAGMPGATTINPAQGRAYVAVWDSAGQFVWARGLGGSSGEGEAVVFTSTGDALVTGTFEGLWGFVSDAGPITLTADTPGQFGCFLAQLRARDGAVVGGRRLAGRGLRPWHLRRFDSGDLLFAGSFGGVTTVDPDGQHPGTVRAAGNDDAIFLRLDPTGALRWATTLGGVGDDEGSDGTVASDGLLWATGRYVGPVNLLAGSSVVTLGSGTDGAGFLLHLNP